MMKRPLTDEPREFLADFVRHGTGVDEWVRPMDLGGCSRSRHSALLAQLARQGFVESKVRSTGERGLKLYRLTSAGRALGMQLACANWSRDTTRKTGDPGSPPPASRGPVEAHCDSALRKLGSDQTK